MVPKVEPWKKLGLPKIGVLVTLMNWAIAWRVARSPSTKRLPRLRSAVASPGPRNDPMPQVPKCLGVPGGSCAAPIAALGFQNCMPNCPPPRGTMALFPDWETPDGQSARGEAEFVPDRSEPKAVIAKPECRVKSDPSDQPPMMVLTRSLAPPPNILPLPNGRS